MKTTVDLSGLPRIDNPGAIHILCSKWYPELVQSLARTCDDILRKAGYSEVITHTLPGSLELPLAARDLLAEDTAGHIDAIICFGIIVKGETYHFEMISNECMRGLGEVMHAFRRPIIVEVIPVMDIGHAAVRAADDEFNKGIEAAAAAVEMVAWRRANTRRG
ncbi:MAG: 6,7-dimethyl-8-ribityllumazine synthase [Pseudomonadales bacterium]|nr:6,7-dimethyl-8-ribityllumazine synthase [Pseudomonadales bacterium]